MSSVIDNNPVRASLPESEVRREINPQLMRFKIDNNQGNISVNHLNYDSSEEDHFEGRGQPIEDEDEEEDEYEYYQEEEGESNHRKSELEEEEDEPVRDVENAEVHQSMEFNINQRQKSPAPLRKKNNSNRGA